MSSQTPKTAISQTNKEEKFNFLERIIMLMESTDFGKSWKPVQTGIIMVSLSAIHICEYLFSKGYQFVLFHRFTQDATENMFSRVRRNGQMPNALQCLESLRGITVTQYLHPIKNTNYEMDTDKFLLDYCKFKSGPVSERKLELTPTSRNILTSTTIFTTRSISELLVAYGSKESIKEWNILYYFCGSTSLKLLPKCCAVSMFFK